MSGGLNKVMLIGRVGRIPEMRRAPNGLAVTTFGLGVSREWQGPDGSPQRALDNFDVIAWGDLAERCDAQLSVDDLSYVEGRLQVRAWQDADGRRHQQTEIVASQVIPLGPQAPAESSPSD
jgi:single-strand DNA-binding protein